MSPNTPATAAYHQLLEPRLLRRAWELVRTGGPAPGIDGHTLDQFAAQADQHLQQIHRQLRDGAFRFQPVRRLRIPKLRGGTRRLGIPTIRDRLVAQALRLLIEPLLAPAFAPSCFAYRCGLGVHQAIDRLLEKCRKSEPWVLESDIKDFFDSIDHHLLLERLARENIDAKLLQLLNDFLRAGSQDGGRWMPTGRGVPQGSPLSPLLANYYLTPFDHAMAGLGYELIRYADDLLLCCSSRAQARQARTHLVAQLARLRLKINRRKTRILDSRRQSFEFLGFVIQPQKLLPAPDNVQRFRELVAQAIRHWAEQPSAERLQVLRSLVGQFAHYYHRCDVAELFAELDQYIGRLWGRHNHDRTGTDGRPQLPVSLQSYLPGRPQSGSPKKNPRYAPRYRGWQKLPRGAKQLPAPVSRDIKEQGQDGRGR